MRKNHLLILILSLCATFYATASLYAQSSQLYELDVTTIDGTQVKLSQYKGQALLIVNVASLCGYTPQYAGLQRLYEKYHSQGFSILAFPSNDFGGQEPGSAAQIKQLCSGKYGVTFPLFSKVKVLGATKHPLYDLLVRSSGGREVSWNFEKFLVDRHGVVVKRFAPGVEPESYELVGELVKILG
jgi:glutathione peroxidase